MKGVVTVKVDGGFLSFPTDVILLEKDVVNGKFTTGADSYNSWEIINGILDYGEPTIPMAAPQAAPKEDSDVPF